MNSIKLARFIMHMVLILVIAYLTGRFFDSPTLGWIIGLLLFHKFMPKQGDPQ